MLLKILDQDRVKILMEEQDIEQYGLPFEKLNYDDPYSRSFIYELIQKTYDETGIDLSESRVMIEVVPGVERAYFILISRIKEKGEQRIEFDKAELPEMDQYIFVFADAMAVLQFIDWVQSTYPLECVVYYYNQKYYAVLSYGYNTLKEKGFERELRRMEEFGTRCEYQYINSAILKEFGDELLDGNQLFSKRCNV